MDEIEGFLLYRYVENVSARVQELKGSVALTEQPEVIARLVDIDFELNRLCRRLDIMFGHER